MIQLKKGVISMDKMDLIDEKDKNYYEFENKLKTIIIECDKKKLKESAKLDPITSHEDYKCYNIKNATQVDHYILDNQLHVYKFTDKNGTPIDYFFSPEPVIEEIEYENRDGKKYKRKEIRDVSFIEYSKGGIGNSLPFDFDKYATSDFIGIATPDFRKTELCSSVQSAPGFNFNCHHLTIFGEFGNRFNIDENKKHIENRDLYNYIKNFSSTKGEKDKNSIDQLKQSLEKVDQIVIKKENKKRTLLDLIKKNKELSNQFDAFASKK